MGSASREAVDRQARLAGNGVSCLTQLRTEDHSVLWLEGRARQAQRDPATNRAANGNYEVAP